MIKDIIILLLVGYLIAKVFTKFVMPIVRVTNAANDHMNRMQQQMEAQMREMNNQKQQQARKVNNNTREGDFIEYEEV